MLSFDIHRYGQAKSPMRGGSSAATSAGGGVGVIAAVVRLAGIGGGAVVRPGVIGVVAVVGLAAIVRLSAIVVAAVERRSAIGVAAVERLLRAAPVPSPARVTFLADHIGLVLKALHDHHDDEDALLYPKLIERVPEQAQMTEQVEHEHQLITVALDTASAACATWRERPSVQTGEALAAALDHLNAVVQPHLDDEEQKVVPLAAVTLTQQEWDAMGRPG